jgi:hypothetical protein
MAGALAALTPTIAMGHELTAHLVVRVYDSYGISGKEMTAAQEALRAILEPAGIAADWRDCEHIGAGARSGASCDHPLEPREILVRLVASGPAMPARVLGFSSVGGQQNAGRLATVLADRVAAMAGRTQSEVGRLLGRVVAHEVSHLLIGTTAHSAAGLMRPNWSDEEVRSDRLMDWLLSWADAQQVRQALLDRPRKPDAPVLKVARSTP